MLFTKDTSPPNPNNIIHEMVKTISSTTFDVLWNRCKGHDAIVKFLANELAEKGGTYTYTISPTTIPDKLLKFLTISIGHPTKYDTPYSIHLRKISHYPQETSNRRFIQKSLLRLPFQAHSFNPPKIIKSYQRLSSSKKHKKKVRL